MAGGVPARGAWLAVPGWAIAAGVPLVFAVGWALPLPGVPLIGFQIIDVAAGAVRGGSRPVARQG